jgi:hypothetical protein
MKGTVPVPQATAGRRLSIPRYPEEVADEEKEIRPLYSG